MRGRMARRIKPSGERFTWPKQTVWARGMRRKRQDKRASLLRPKPVKLYSLAPTLKELRPRVSFSPSNWQGTFRSCAHLTRTAPTCRLTCWIPPISESSGNIPIHITCLALRSILAADREEKISGHREHAFRKSIGNTAKQGKLQAAAH